MGNRFGIIGAGIAGAWLANRLVEAGQDVVVYEKSRGFGGRMATRRRDDMAFDHGAQFFTARTKAFKGVLEHHGDHLAPWQPSVVTLGDVTKPYKRDWFEPHFIGVPGMGSLCRELLGDVTVELKTEVSALDRVQSEWRLTGDQGCSKEFDWIISTAPAEQTLNLVPFAPLTEVTYSPCFALMGKLEAEPAFDAAVVRGKPIEWLAVTSSRHGRPQVPGIVAHASPEWSTTHFDGDRDQLTEVLREALDELDIKPVTTSLHRWRFARVVQTFQEPFWLDQENQVAACGDWGVGPRVEDAFTSADLLFERLVRLL